MNLMEIVEQELDAARNRIKQRFAAHLLGESLGPSAAIETPSSSPPITRRAHTQMTQQELEDSVQKALAIVKEQPGILTMELRDKMGWTSTTDWGPRKVLVALDKYVYSKGKLTRKALFPKVTEGVTAPVEKPTDTTRGELREKARAELIAHLSQYPKGRTMAEMSKAGVAPYLDSKERNAAMSLLVSRKQVQKIPSKTGRHQDLIYKLIKA